MGSVLLTGGAGYIGSHVAIALLEGGYEVVILDDLSNSYVGSIDIIREVSGVSDDRLVFIEGDICDYDLVVDILGSHDIGSVIHFAGLKSVNDSVKDPLLYYRVNVGGSLVLLRAMLACGVSLLLYSSSALVYGVPRVLPLSESHECNPVNPYGRSKYLSEQIFCDVAGGESGGSGGLCVISLRYFNPLGSHASGLLGDNPRGVANNLLPALLRSSRGDEVLRVFGSDYDTRDGSCIRDYIHISDLVSGHVSALDYGSGRSGYHCYNLGSQSGYTVFEVIRAFELVSGLSLSYDVVGRRDGDVAVLCADSSRAGVDLGWRSVHSLEDMLGSSWHWWQNRV